MIISRQIGLCRAYIGRRLATVYGSYRGTISTRPPGGWFVPISRPFAVGQLTGNGWLCAEEGVLRFHGAWPFPGPRFRIAHIDPDVEVQVHLLFAMLIPWIAVEAILHDHDNSVVIGVPIWSKKRLLLLIGQHGFTPRVRKVWFSSSVRRARKWLLKEEVLPKW